MNLFHRDDDDDRRDDPRRRRSSRPDGGSGRGPQLPSPAGRPFRTMAFWLLVLLLALVAYRMYAGNLLSAQRADIPYTLFLQEVEKGNIDRVTFVEETRTVLGDLRAAASERVAGRDVPFKSFKSNFLGDGASLAEKTRAANPGATIVVQSPGINWMSMLFTWLPLVLFGVLWMFVLRQMQSGGSAALRFGKSKARVLMESQPRVTFKDVAGCEEAKQELQEIIEFLKEPQKFQRLGGRIPKGALLLGPPGSGKTLLAKAVAGEAGVPFFSMSGSDFVEMFVGVGASRVRDLFEQGKRNAPCILFIDEIDAVGRHRGAGLGGGHDEREQTLNQLLVEMDGFESNEGVIMIAATNRPDVLDPALMRPGRFDRQIVVDWPDMRGREGILKVHTRKIPLADDVDLKQIARSTPGMAGADLANIVNESALLAARRNHKKVTLRDFEDAKDKVMLGMERRSLVMTEEERKTTAIHEAGHALLAWLIPGSDPVTKVTIIPRGRTLGVTAYTPNEERHNHSKRQLEDRLCHAMGGRAAELLVFHHLTTGAANDLEQATTIARSMVTRFGMSDKLGPLTFGRKEEMVFLGKEISTTKDYSEQTAVLIDQEVREIIERAHQHAMELLKGNVDKLTLLANTLLERETLDGDEMDRVLRGETLEPLHRGDPDAPAPASAPVLRPEGGEPLDAFGQPSPRPA
ncbi:MAG TPA: ATP-dependent zinc metalloprotease FtsH [Candidatus Eisenbacteria bacterium]|nr:ATP-dependent zinc metalloprotease FtsH [Candidatus Eisenbacteria bacterium]